MSTITHARLDPGPLPRVVHSLEPAFPADTNFAGLYGAAWPGDFAEVPAALAASVATGWTWDGSAFAAPVVAISASDLLGYASTRQNERLADVWSFDVGAAGQPDHVVTTKLDPAGQFAMLKIDVWAQTNAATAGASLPYSNVDYSATTLNPAEASSLAAQAGILDAKSYAILNELAAGIGASPPTVTTFAQIDAAFAALAA